jgi:acyl carrier protein
MVSDRLKSVILKQLALREFDIQDDTTATMVPNWDSLSHINVVLAIETEYAIKFKAIEILKVKNIGELQRLVDSKLAANAT